MKGIPAYVYRSAALGDCTNGGLSSKTDRVIICGEGIPEMLEASDLFPALIITRNGKFSWKATPDTPTESGHVGYMFGGNFVHSGDSRFMDAFGSAPIRIFDRQESRELYASMD
jgi:hypothetical protein